MWFFFQSLNVLRIAFRPSLILPDVSVRSVANINFAKLKEAGYEGIIFDRDNCLTKPRKDVLVPSLEEPWKECLQAFGAGNILIVSNSAGTPKDASLLQAEALRRGLSVDVLVHNAPKPACIKSIQSYFGSRLGVDLSMKEAELASGKLTALPRLVVIGDRLSTDIVLSKRLPRSLSIWTQQVWQEESPAVRIARLLETGLLAGVRRWKGIKDHRRGEEYVKEDNVKEDVSDVHIADSERSGWLGSLLDRLRRL